jgi:hypothetical protein
MESAHVWKMMPQMRKMIIRCTEVAKRPVRKIRSRAMEER